MKFDTPATDNPIDELRVVGHPTDRIDGRLNLYILEKLLRLPIDYFERHPTGETTSRVAQIWKVRHFLTGQQSAINTVASAVGFQYARVPGPDGQMNQFAHASAVYVLTPEGKVFDGETEKLA